MLLAIVFVLSTTLAAAASTAFICMRHGWTWSLLLRSQPLRYGTVLIGVSANVVGLPVLLVTHDGLWASAGALVATLPAVRFLWRAQKRASALTKIDRAGAEKLLAELRERQPPKGSSSLAFEVSAVTTAKKLATAGQLDLAVKILDLLDWDTLEGPARTRAASTMSECYLLSGHLEHARNALERGRGQDLTDQNEEDELALLDARLLAHEGRGDEVLSRKDTLDQIVARQPWRKPLAVMIRIHALAGRGEADAALALMASLRDECGPEALALLSRPPGPATAMATELSRTHAYR